MTSAHDDNNQIDLVELQEELLSAARSASSGRAAHTVTGGRDAQLRQTAMALLAGAELAEHASPPEATLQVLRGRVRLSAGARGWELPAGVLIPIPAERHALAALDDSVVLLTVLRSAPDAGEVSARVDPPSPH